MDETLKILFDELCLRIEELQKKNPEVNTDTLMRSCVMIQSYIDGFSKEEEPKEAPQSLPDISYEQLCKLTRPPRITPRGHLGPAYTMTRYAEEEENKRARIVDDVIRQGKELDKNKKPFF